MNEVIAWCGFLGAWLLVAGPIYQAAIELDDEEIEHDEFERVKSSVPPPPKISLWWLLIPPAYWYLRQRRGDRYRQATMEALSEEQIEQWMHFSETATAWLFVACGGALIAVKETWGLRVEHEWPQWTFWLLVVVMIALSAANTAVRIRRRNEILERVTNPGPTARG
jgi:hypothetical protein